MKSFTAITAAYARSKIVQRTPRCILLLARDHKPSSIENIRSFATTPRRTQEETVQEHDSKPSSTIAKSIHYEEKQDLTEHIKKRDKEDHPEFLRSFMRTVPHPVAIITARRDSTATDSSVWVGATVSSFNTVTFTPEPIVSFNLLKESATLESIRTTGYFAVTLLRNNSRGAQLADLFTKGNDPSPFDDAQHDENHQLLSRLWKIDGVTDLLPPLVYLKSDNGKDYASSFAVLCELKQIVEVGDHAIVLGRSRWVKAVPSNSWGSRLKQTSGDDQGSSKDVCLTYAHGSYSGRGLRSGSLKSWLVNDNHREVEIPIADRVKLKALKRHYAKATNEISAAIQSDASVGTKASRFTAEVPTEDLEEALSYYKGRLESAQGRGVIMGLLRRKSLPISSKAVRKGRTQIRKKAVGSEAKPMTEESSYAATRSVSGYYIRHLKGFREPSATTAAHGERHDGGFQGEDTEARRTEEKENKYRERA